MTAEIRRAVPDDVPQIARIEEDSFPDPWTPDMIAPDIEENDRSYMAVACVDGRVAGYADMWIAADEAQLLNIAVDRELRGNDLGRTLLGHMFSEARKRGCSLMTLEVRADNSPAIALYLGQGFVQTGIRPGYYEYDGEDAILMDKEL